MVFHVPRTCTEKNDESNIVSYPIADFRQRAVYVLLGEPGAGKSSLFETEAKSTHDGLFISARDFIALDREEWRDKTLFIDGLDEARAGNDNARTPLDAIRGKLDKLACKRFRISCRAADWLGSVDNKDIKQVSPDQEVTVLYLDPLSSDDILLLLQKDQLVNDAQEFVKKAQQFGLSALLENPQTLDMLIIAVKGGQQWPTSKKEVYELASKQLATEFNDGHSLVQQPTTPQLLEAAGFLCAIQIIGNVSEFTKNLAIEGRFCLNDINPPEGLQLRSALKTRLFKRINADEFTYIHRSVAEYLAAHFIAVKINDGLLFKRILALTTGFDGGIVAALRGLMAWLSVLSPTACDHLIEIDPVGVIVNGDASQFPRQAKAHLYRALSREVKTTGILHRDWNSNAFATITTNEMAPELMEIFKTLSRNDSEQFLLYYLLKGLTCSESIAEIKLSLLNIIRDHSYLGDIRSVALEAFSHQYPEDLDSLLLIAEDIRQGKVVDTANSLLELLLEKLFPAKIPPANIFQYVVPEKNIRVVFYHMFWRKVLGERLTDIDLAIVLDKLFELGPEFLERMPQDVLVDTAGQLIIRGLVVHGINITAERLYNWLSIGIDQFNTCKLPREQRQQIANWLESHPDCYLAVIRTGLKQIKTFENINWEIHKVFTRLQRANPPKNIAHWWLNQALLESDFKISCAYFEQAFVTLYDEHNDRGLSLDYFVNWLTDHPEYFETYQKLTYLFIPEWRFEQNNSAKKWAKQRDEEQSKNLNYLREHKAKIADGSAAPHIFHHLAITFNDITQTNSKSSEERLSEFLSGDESLIAAAKSGLRNMLQRNDLPSTNEIFTLAKSGKYHYIRLPVLVCMDMLYQEHSDILHTLSDELLSKTLAFCFTEGALNEAWLKEFIKSKPELVSSLFIEYVTLQFTAKSQYIRGLHNLAYDQDFKKIAQLAVLPLLKKYPVRGYKDHITNLHYLLDAAISNIDKEVLLTLIETKLVCTGMDLAQRIYWLATGLVITPEEFEDKIKQMVTGKTERINHLSYFLYPSFASKMYERYDFPVSTKGMLIELLAPRCNPAWSLGGGVVTRAMEERDIVRYWLDNLAYNTSPETTAVLTDLLNQPKLSAWHTLIQNVQQTQQQNRREALFKHPNVNQVINTLNNLKPANVADLAALTIDCLEQLSVEMHGSNTDSYKHFWNDEKNGKPRYEDICRNYLYERLKEKLARYDVQVDKEAHQAKDKRADLQVCFINGGKTFHLPIEIKRDYNPALWKTIHAQLIPLYTIAPETEGRGVYLVIWLNHTKLPTHPQGLPPPKSAEQLAAMLKNTMTSQEKKLIDVFVLDVSKK